MAGKGEYFSGGGKQANSLDDALLNEFWMLVASIATRLTNDGLSRDNSSKDIKRERRNHESSIISKSLR